MTVKISDSDYPIEYDPPKIVRGADWIGWAFDLMEDDNVTPINTTSYTAQMIIMESWNGETYKTLSIGSGITMTALSGLFNISLSKTDIDDLNFRTAVYKLIVTDDNGGMTPYFMGKLEIIG